MQSKLAPQSYTTKPLELSLSILCVPLLKIKAVFQMKPKNLSQLEHNAAMSDRYWASPYDRRAFETYSSHPFRSSQSSTYPQELDLDDFHDDGPYANDRSTASRQQHIDQPSRSETYLPRRRVWGQRPESTHDSFGGQSPMSRWERESSRDNPWNGIAGVYAGSGGGEGYGYNSSDYPYCDERSAGSSSAYAARGNSYRVSEEVPCKLNSLI